MEEERKGVWNPNVFNIFTQKSKTIMDSHHSDLGNNAKSTLI